MSEKVIELRSGGLGEAIMELAKKVTLLVREMAREKRVQLQITGSNEAINLAKSLHLKELRRKNNAEDIAFRSLQGQNGQKEKAQHQHAVNSPKGHPNKGPQAGGQKQNVTSAQKASESSVKEQATTAKAAELVEGGEVKGVEEVPGSMKPLTHKFPPLTDLSKK